jgi:hypothetical protein
MFFIFLKNIFLYLFIFLLGTLGGAVLYKKAQINETNFISTKRIEIINSHINKQTPFQAHNDNSHFNFYHEILHQWLILINKVDQHFFSK